MYSRNRKRLPLFPIVQPFLNLSRGSILIIAEMVSLSDDANKQFRSAFEAAVADYGLTPMTQTQVDQIAMHYSMLCRWNPRMNLTRIIKPEEAARLHYAESLLGGRFVADAST